VLDVAGAVAAALDAVELDDAALDDDELDPHALITAAIMATAKTPAPMRARSDLNMGHPLLSRPALVPIRVESTPGSVESKAVRPACSKSSQMKDFAIRIVGFAIWIAPDRPLTPRQQDGHR
jgi:hypothetical protein